MSTHSSHDKSISIAKGITISLMVIIHSGGPYVITVWLFLFTMHLFFFLSGYLFKVKHLDNFNGYLKNKVKGYYIPFVKWTLIFLLFHNVFADINIYNNKYSLIQFVDRTIRAFTMRGSEQLLGGFWFLIEIFIASLIAYWPIKIIRHYAKSPLTINISLAFTIIVLVISAYYLDHSRILFKISNVTLLATAFFLLGHLYRNISIKVSSAFSYVLCFAGYLSALWVDRIIKFQAYGMDIFIMIPIALISTIGILGVCRKISEWKIGNIFDFIGMNTLVILTFHMLCFKAVSLYIIYRDSLPIEQLSDFPFIWTNNTFDWILYSFVGVTLPIIGAIASKKIKEKYILKSYHRIKSTILSVLQ